MYLIKIEKCSLVRASIEDVNCEDRLGFFFCLNIRNFQNEVYMERKFENSGKTERCFRWDFSIVFFCF